MDPKQLDVKVEGLKNLLSHLLEEVTVLQGHHGQMLRVLQNMEAHQEHDELSGLLRRGAFFKKWQSLLGECQKWSENCGMLMIDIDHFKKVNDTHGHPTGDEVIKGVAELLKNFESSQCFSGRYGGEEFVLAIKGSDEEILETAERVRAEVEKLTGPIIASNGQPSEDQKWKCTLSVGMASVQSEGFDAPRLLKAADEALYRAKKKGRNRVCAA